MMSRVIHARNQQRFTGVITDSEASWRMLMRHFLRGWREIASYSLKREKLGLSLLRNFIDGHVILQAHAFFKLMKAPPQKLAHLATIEKRFKMNPGALKLETFGYYGIGDNGNIIHLKTDRIIGMNDLRINHGCLTLYDIFHRNDNLQKKIFFIKTLEYIKSIEFLERLDIFYHRVLARKVMDQLRRNWLYGIGHHSNNLNSIQNLINFDPQFYRSTDYDNYMKFREENGKGAAVIAGLQKLKNIMNRKPNDFIRRINHIGDNEVDQAQKKREILLGGNALMSIIKNYKNWSFNKIRTAYHSGLLMHNDYLTRKLKEIKIEYIKKLIQEATFVLEGTFKRHRRNDANHFLIRLLNPNTILNKILRGDKILRQLIKINKFMNLKRAFEKLKITEEKKAAIDPSLLDQFSDILGYFFNNRKSEAFSSIQSYVMEFEVLRIEEVSNSMIMNQGEQASNLLDNALERTLLFDKNNNQNPHYNLSRNSLDSRSFQ